MRPAVGGSPDVTVDTSAPPPYINQVYQPDVRSHGHGARIDSRAHRALPDVHASHGLAPRPAHLLRPDWTKTCLTHSRTIPLALPQATGDPLLQRTVPGRLHPEHRRLGNRDVQGAGAGVEFPVPVAVAGIGALGRAEAALGAADRVGRRITASTTSARRQNATPVGVTSAGSRVGIGASLRRAGREASVIPHCSFRSPPADGMIPGPRGASSPRSQHPHQHRQMRRTCIVHFAHRMPQSGADDACSNVNSSTPAKRNKSRSTEPDR
jgi:hypothetical protein